MYLEKMYGDLEFSIFEDKEKILTKAIQYQVTKDLVNVLKGINDGTIELKGEE